MKKQSIKALILVTAIVLAFASCAQDNTKEPVSSSGDITTESQANTTDIGNDTTSNIQDTSAPDTTESSKKLGASGLEAVNGTVPTYVDGGQDHINLKLGDKYGIVMNCDASFKSLNLYTATYDTDCNDRITVKVFTFDTDYQKSVSGEAVVDMTITGFPNGGWYMVTFESPLPAGEYVIELTGTSDGDDYGVAIWKQYGSPFFLTYKNGEELDDVGIWAQVIVE